MSFTVPSSPPGVHISADRAICRLEDDRYGLSETFIPRLARVVVEWPAAEGSVFGLYGAWGSGKTSILCMLEDYVGRRSADRSSDTIRYRTCRIVRFHPWFYDDHATLVASFFATLAKELGKGKRTAWSSVADGLKTMGKFLAVASRGVSLLGVRADIAEIVEGLEKAATAGSEFTELMDSGEQKMTEARQKVERGLHKVGEQGGRLVILLDDVDRLAREEIVPLLRLLRIVADLPYVTIVVAMDEERVRKLLRQGEDAYGERYLEKIVQVFLHVPMLDPARLITLLQEELSAIFGEHGTSLPSGLTPSRFAGGPRPLELLRSMIQTPRDLARFGNALRVLLLADDSPRDLDPVDAALIEAVHVFLPDLYERIRTNERFLTRTSDLYGEDFWEDYRDKAAGEHKKIKDRRIARLRRIVHGSTDKPGEPLLDKIVGELFGDLKRDDAEVSGEADDAAARRSIRSSDAFYRYFGLKGVPAAIPRQQVERIVESLVAAAESESAEAAGEALKDVFEGRDQESANQIVRDLRVHLTGKRSVVMTTMAEGVLLLRDILSPRTIRELLVVALNGVVRLYNEPKREIAGRLEIAAGIVERAIEVLPSALDALVVLEHPEGHYVDARLMPRLWRQWLIRMGRDVAAGREPFPKEGDDHLEGYAIGAGFRLTALAALNGEVELVREPSSFYVQYLSEHPDELFTFFAGAEGAVRQSRFDRGEAAALDNRGEPQAVADGIRAAMADLEPVRRAIEMRLAQGEIAVSDSEHLAEIKALLDEPGGCEPEGDQEGRPY